MVKLPVRPAAMLSRLSLLRVKQFLSLPENSTVKFPVSPVPEFITLTAAGFCSPYPTFSSVKLYVPVLSNIIPYVSDGMPVFTCVPLTLPVYPASVGLIRVYTVYGQTASRPVNIPVSFQTASSPAGAVPFIIVYS